MLHQDARPAVAGESAEAIDVAAARVIEALTAASEQAARTLRAITFIGARRAGCTYCGADAGAPCATPAGFHLARFAVACRESFITRDEFATVVLAAGPLFTTATPICEVSPGGAR
jgi:hypothetical protein